MGNAATTAEELVRFEGVGRRYGDFVALKALDLSLYAGEVLGLVGPNGAGKTTALRILCGLLPASGGRAWIGGADASADSLEARRLRTFVPDGAPLYPGLSPRQHLTLVGRLHGLSEDRIETESERLLAALDLSDRIDDPVGGFSRGMRQKTALALAILPRPKVLILDEPLSGLDVPTAAMIKEVLRAWADRGAGVIYTSHLLDVVERVCDRVAILARGELVAVGSLEELRTRSGTGDGTLEQVFGSLTSMDDPRERAERLLGEPSDAGPD